MPSLDDRQREFTERMLNPQTETPPGLLDPDGFPAVRRFGVYRNNYAVSLIDGLKAAYPVVLRLVGDEFFVALALAHIRGHAPTSPSLLLYGDAFAETIEDFPEAGDLLYLGDVARIERAWLESYHSAEAEPLAMAELAAMDPDVFATRGLRLHPSVRVLRSAWPSLSIWWLNIDGQDGGVDLDQGGEDTLVCRPVADVVARAMAPGCVEFLGALAIGDTVAAAAAAAIEADARFDLADSLTVLVDAGAFVSPTGTQAA